MDRENMYTYILHDFSDNFNSTSSIEYAVSWLLDKVDNALTNNVVTNNFWIMSNLNVDNRHSINQGYVMWEDGFVVKKLFLDDEFKTVYSPYDLTLFFRTELSARYVKLITKNNKNKLIPLSIEQSPPQVTLKNEYSSLIKNFNIIESKNNNINNKNNKDNNADSDTDDESISSEQLRDLEEKLDKMMSTKEKINEDSKKKEYELADITMEENYKKKINTKNEEKEKEKRNIFKSDLAIYKKINNNLKTNEDFEYPNNYNIMYMLQKYVPDFFAAKYSVIFYLDQHYYLENESLDNPSDEIYELFNILYNARYNELYVPPDDFIDIVDDFIDSLPDVDIPTPEVIHKHLNRTTEYSMFQTDITNT